MVLDTDSRVLTLAFARMADALGNFFLIIVLPLSIASGRVTLSGIAVALVFAPSLALAGDLAGERGSGTTLSVDADGPATPQD
ncbi:hypothetical protein [Haloarcula saliterrae]|uniref:hypothetical protein n=1 Tax=Haloarcula saliterrae TaxID=2950534 RepID=UPI003AAAF2E9